MADRHFRVDKQVIDQPLILQSKKPSNKRNGKATTQLDSEIPESVSDIRTVVRVSLLNERSHRQAEIAQLAGGQSAQEAMTFAESLLTKAANWRQN
jgi:DNA repair protein RecN (Recombination protein N)